MTLEHNKKWDYLWINLHIATMNHSLNSYECAYGAIQQAALGIKDNKIVFVGTEKDLPQPANELANIVKDGQGYWATPGLIDCHTHLVYAGHRAHEFELRMLGKSYVEIAQQGGGILASVRAIQNTSEAEIYAETMWRLQAHLKEGITAIELKTGYGLDYQTELKMLNVIKKIKQTVPITIQATFLGAHTIPPTYKSNPDAYIDQICHEMLPAFHEQGLIDAVDAYCETIAFTPQQIRRVFNVAKSFGLPVKLHADQLSDFDGAELAAEYQALSADHLEYTSEKGIASMAEAGTVGVLLPGAFYNLRETHKPPLDLLRQYQVPIAIATDSNPGTSPVGSLLLMLNMACNLFGLTPEEALAGVTCNAARALGLSQTQGTIAMGKDANIALWQIDDPAELAYRIGYNPCAGVINQGDEVIPKDYRLY